MDRMQVNIRNHLIHSIISVNSRHFLNVIISGKSSLRILRILTPIHISEPTQVFFIDSYSYRVAVLHYSSYRFAFH